MSISKHKIFTANDLEELLKNRFCPPAWAFLPQVRNGTGYSNITRTADAIAMSLWPSRGLHLNGFEIKVRRGDWLSELKNPEKAEAIARYCDFFWLVAPKEIAKIEEVPQNWGLLIPFGSTVKVVKEAKQLEAKQMDRLFFAAILRKAQETITPDSKIKECIVIGRKEGAEIETRKFKHAKEDHSRLQETVKNFENKSGVHIDRWRGDNIGDAVRMVLNGEHLRIKKSLASLLERSRDITEAIERELNKDNKGGTQCQE